MSVNSENNVEPDRGIESNDLVQTMTTRLRMASSAVVVSFMLTAIAVTATAPPLLGVAVLVIGFITWRIVEKPREDALRHARELAKTYQTLEESTLETFAALNAAVEAKDSYTAGHGLRVTLMSILIAQEMQLSERELDTIRHAATFHDIGKLAVPDDVLRKDGRLTDAEFEIMKIHPVESERICGKLAVLSDALPAIRHHHERFDGRGYPDGLYGHYIPLGARIIAVADTWDAITSDRPYRPGAPAIVALDEIRRVSGSQFDSEVVEAFLNVLARDPWMFGLEHEDLRNDPAAGGKLPEPMSRGSRRNEVVNIDAQRKRSTNGASDDDNQSIAA